MYCSSSSEMRAFFLDPNLEHQLETAVEHGEHNSHINLPPQRVRELLDKLQESTKSQSSGSVIIAGSQARPFLRMIAENSLPGVAVISHAEIPPGIKLISNGTIQ